MKIVKTDNYDRDHIDDKLIAENVHEWYAPIIVNMLNEKFSEIERDWYYIAVADDYELKRFEP